MKKCFYSLILSVVLSGCLVLAAQEPEQKTNTQIATGKLLKSPQMPLLKKKLEQNLIAIVRTKVTCAKCAKAILLINDLQQIYENNKKKDPSANKYFDSDEQERAFIVENLKLILDPVKLFFEEVHNYKSIITPVIAESLGQDSAKSFLTKFFTTNESVTTFFDHAIKTIEDLKTASLELITVFNDLNENLSPETKIKCTEMIHKMQESKKQKPVV